MCSPSCPVQSKMRAHEFVTRFSRLHHSIDPPSPACSSWLLFNQPLAISSLTVWLQIYRSNVDPSRSTRTPFPVTLMTSSSRSQMVRIHLRGQEAKNELKRPFNANAPAGFMGGGGPATDKASIEAAEKANLLHRKEEF